MSKAEERKNRQAIVKTIIKNKDADILKSLYSLYTSCKDYYSDIVKSLIFRRDNSTLIDFYKLVDIDIDDEARKYFNINAYLIVSFATEFYNNEIFDHFIVAPGMTNVMHSSLFRDALINKNEYVLSRLETMDLLPLHHKEIRGVLEGDENIIKDYQSWDTSLVREVFILAIESRNISDKNKYFLTRLIDIIGMERPGFDFELVLKYTVRNDSERNSIDSMDLIKFLMSSLTVGPAKRKISMGKLSSGEIFMDPASPSYLLKFVYRGRNLEFLIHHGARDFTKLRLAFGGNKEEYQSFLTCCVFSYGPNIFDDVTGLDDDNGTNNNNGTNDDDTNNNNGTNDDDTNNDDTKQNLSKQNLSSQNRMTSKKISAVYCYLKKVNAAVDHFLPRVLSIIVMNYSFALSRKLLNYNFN